MKKETAPSVFQSKLTNTELSDLSVGTMSKEHAVSPRHPHLLLLRLHGCIIQAQMGFCHEKQSMTCAKQWQADDGSVPFDDGRC